MVGVDYDSSYCYLLTAAERRNSDTWGWHLLELLAQGLQPDYTIADGGLGLRAGQAAAWDNVRSHGDLFHRKRQFGQLVFSLELAISMIKKREKLEIQMERARKNRCGNTRSKKLAIARENERNALQLAQDIKILADWMNNDIFALAGPVLSERKNLFYFIVSELCFREPQCRNLCILDCITEKLKISKYLQ